ncbi:MAG: DNA mismatch repair protein MutS, partial [Desulfosudaceae bacterium]
EQGRNNYVLAVASRGKDLGFACIDISTGTFRLSQSRDKQAVRDELLRIAPSEVVIPESASDDELLAFLPALFADRTITTLPDETFDPEPARERLIRQLRTRSLEGFGCSGMTAGISAAGALLSYIQETQKQEAIHFTGIDAYQIDNFLFIDEMSCRNLELTANLRSGTRQGTLIAVMDHCVTAMGSRLLRQWMQYPLLDADAIRSRQAAVAEAVADAGVRGRLRVLLKSVYDLERLASKTVMGHINARDMLALLRSLQVLPEIHAELAAFAAPLFAVGDYLSETDLAALRALAELLAAAIREDAPPSIGEGGIIRPEYDARLAELIDISRNSKSWLARLEAREKEETGITTLKVRYNKVFGYYLEVPKARAGEVPAHYVRKQTLVNAERYITDELKEFESKALSAEEQRVALETEIFADIRRQVVEECNRIYAAAAFIAGVDVLTNLAEIAVSHNYVQPEIVAGGRIEIEEGRHPVVEQMLTGERYVPNSACLDNEANQLLVITGPNMAGKSTVLRQVALLVIMAQMGSFVPAKNARTGLVDRIFTRVGALDNLAAGQSTFMVEMEETANIINNATPDSLVVIDEIGRGTSTYDGLSIAWAVAEHLHDLDGRGVKTLFATHYHELTELAGIKPRVQNFNIAVKEWNDEIIFLRKLVAGSTARSYGIQVARLAGIPAAVIARAKEILYDIEQGSYTFEHQAAGASIPAAEGPVQMSFFDSGSNVLIDHLLNLDINRLTPLEALNYLSDLKKKAAKESGGRQ